MKSLIYLAIFVGFLALSTATGIIGAWLISLVMYGVTPL